MMNLATRVLRHTALLAGMGALAACGGGLQRSDVPLPCYEALPEYGQCLVEEPGSNDLTPECKFIADICAAQTDPSKKLLCQEALANCQLNVFAGKPPVHPQHNRCGKKYKDASDEKCAPKDRVP